MREKRDKLRKRSVGYNKIVRNKMYRDKKIKITEVNEFKIETKGKKVIK